MAHVDSGKCFSKETLIMMADGTVQEAKTLKLGDKLMGPDGKERIINEIHSGSGEMFEITQKMVIIILSMEIIF